MIKSMTGFGRFEVNEGQKKLTVEMKSVNHRYLEVSVKMPKKLNFFEAGIRSILKQYIGRGKVDIFLCFEDFAECKTVVKYNTDIAKEYYRGMREMGNDFGINNDISVSLLSKMPEVFSLEEQGINEEELWNLVEVSVRSACERFVETRIAEGEQLKIDLMDKLDTMFNLVAFIEERAPQIIIDYRKKLMDKVQELLGKVVVDESILATEITVFADKICVDEEIVRLRAHMNHMRDTLQDGENIGRKLDFIAQEMNREANTILSKASDLEVTNNAIDLKTEIEKIREQIQNIE